MKSTLCLAIILALSILADAIPSIQNRASRIPLQRRSLDVTSTQSATGAQRVSNLIRNTHDKYAYTLAAYERNTGSRHPLDATSRSPPTGLLKRASGGPVAFTNEENELWYGTLTIGTPPEAFTVDFDTGSADLIVPDKLCVVTCDGHNKYDSSLSSTSHTVDIPFFAAYGSGQMGGSQYQDAVGVGGYQIVDQTFGGALVYSKDFSPPNFYPDGLSGLGFESISALRATTLMDNLRSSGQLPEPVFGFKLSTTGGESELSIGTTDSTAFNSDSLVYLPVVEQGYWQVTLGSLGRSGYQVSESVDAAAIIDTGTTLILAPRAIVEDYYSGIQGAHCGLDGVCTVPCDTINSTTPILTFGGEAFAVSPEMWNFGPMGQSDCAAGLGVFDDVSGVIVGDVFLREVYSIFDFSDPPRVGFATLLA